eukprot:CAMPEP_0175056426 /NCGR_PEP_ID=MMETSP0052_2-20121109/10662_1 /TAXON_ID=51329 ORGANISM="Polytomella parva, Strain SAG 63-3" /NCGR_SAMPLE_ID=MMETSP0052_2 /ASSEMBLY_ACC=CAM_ASM_000194 /LENGTH=32 /DNA_ID= /DNA_START= /DNA_END= /DNA_ORIENTATION=
MTNPAIIRSHDIGAMDHKTESIIRGTDAVVNG